VTADCKPSGSVHVSFESVGVTYWPPSPLTLAVSTVSGDNQFLVQRVTTIRIQPGDSNRQLRGELWNLKPGDIGRIDVENEMPLLNGDYSWFTAGVRWQVSGSNSVRVDEWNALLVALQGKLK
jgi:hypothetical protein